MQELDGISKRDWRLQAITTLSKDWKSPYTGVLHKKGVIVENVNLLKIKRIVLNMPIPNPTAMFLNLAFNNLEKANNNLSFLRKDLNKIDLRQLDKELFDGIEYYISSIIFSYTALESFANEIIPDNYEYKIERQDKKCTEIYNKEQIERNLSLKIKIGDILPKILNIDFDKSGKLWNKYYLMEELRNDIIHMKSKDRKGINPDNKNISYDHIWNRLINNNNLENFPKISLEIISLFLKDKKIRWLKLLTY